MTLKVVIIGCGKIADGHVGVIQNLRHLARVVAVCDTERLMAEQLASRFGVLGVYDNCEAMLAKEHPDVVHITTPPGPHLHIAEQALAAGCHLYVEKPLTPTHAETLELISKARAAGKKLTAGYSYLFDPPARRMRELVTNGALGEVVHMESFYGYDLSGPFGSAVLADGEHWVHRLPGQLLQNNIDHMLYKLAEYFDDDHPKLLTFGSIHRPQRFGDARDNFIDELRLILSGKRVTATATFSSFARPVSHMFKIYGTRNTATADFSARTVILENTLQIPTALGRLVPAFERAGRLTQEGLRNAVAFGRSQFHFFAGLNYLISNFYQSIATGREPPIPMRTLIWTSEVMNRIWEQFPAPQPTTNEEETK